MNAIDLIIASIDERVKELEKLNDEWIAKHGEYNSGIYNKIQELMDQRDMLLAIA